jgi:cytochrome P450
VSTLQQEVPVIEVRRSDPAFARDGYAVWDQIRAAGPVVYSPGPLGGPPPMPFGDAYLVARFPAVRSVLGNPKRYPQLPGIPESAFGDTTFEAIEDPHRHGEIRGVWSYEVQRASLREKRLALVDGVVREYTDPFVDRVLSGETADAVGVHNAIPISIMLHMMDLPLEDREQLHQWAEAIGPEHVEKSETQGSGRPRRGTLELRDYLMGVLADRRKDLEAGRRHPGSDLVSMMAGSEVAKTMTDSEIVANYTQLVFAGAGTTAALMSSLVTLLAQLPDQRRALLEDRSLIAPAIEEVLRFRGPAHTAPPRVVADGDAQIEGFRVPEGAVVAPIVGAANRDPDRWENAAGFDIQREPKQHLGFGFGMHFCFGASLARFQTAVYLERLLDRLPDWQLAADIDLTKDPFLGSVSAPIPSIPVTRS